MELKLGIQAGDLVTFGSNRTFMELKYMWQDWEDSQEDSSNRTFMELKLFCV